MLLADSLGTKESAAGSARVPLAAPKLVHVAPCAYAAHAGTWQPALEMLTRLRHEIIGAQAPRPFSDRSVNEQLAAIGSAVYAEFQKRFALERFDVRVSLVLTGPLRCMADAEAGRSSSVVLWEASNGFEPKHVTGGLYFGGSPALSDLASTIIRHPFVRETMSQGPLACAQGLLAAHAALARLSTSISPDANLVVCGEGDEHTVLHGTLVALPNSAILNG